MSTAVPQSTEDPPPLPEKSEQTMEQTTTSPNSAPLSPETGSVVPVENGTCENVKVEKPEMKAETPVHNTPKTMESSPQRKIITSDPTMKSNWLKRFIHKKVEGLTRRQILICIIFAFVEFFAATVISIQAPFFPEVAQRKGATSMEYGLVFGIFELTVFIMSPLFGAKMNAIGPKRMFNWGIFTTGTCCIIFGFLNQFEGRASFIVSCFVVRLIEAVGDAAFVVASFTIIALEFPDSIAATFGTMETFYGLGMIVGPTLGGALYEVGGYTLPFALMGGFLFLCAWATYFFLPEIGESPSIEKGNQQLLTTSGLDTFKMLRFPVIFMISYSIVATATGVGFIHATLQPHLDGAHGDLNKFLVGSVFILNGGVYAITAPTWGKICDNSKQPKYFTVIGSIFTISGFCLVGPLPFLPLETKLWNICLGLILFGLGLGATLVSAFIQALQDAISLGYPDDVSTYGLVSGLWTSMTALGFFIGATSGGFLDHHVGFRWGTIFVLGGQFILILMLIIYFWTTKKNNDSNEMDLKATDEDQQPHGVDLAKEEPPSPTAATNPSFQPDE